MLFNLVPPLVDLATQHIRVISAANDDRWLVYRKDAEKLPLGLLRFLHEPA